MFNKVIKVGRLHLHHIESHHSKLINALKMTLEAEIDVVDIDQSQIDEVDVILEELSTVPMNAYPSWTIAALYDRYPSNYHLVINTAKTDLDKDLRLIEGGTIYVSSALIGHQLTSIRGDLSWQIKDVDQAFTDLQNDIIDSMIMPAYMMPQYDLSTFTNIALHVSEITPMPGQGVMAILCKKEDVTLRKSMLALHHDSISQNTNVERMILRQWHESQHQPICAHCHTDNNGYHHVYAAAILPTQNTIIRARTSQSTTHHMADNIIQSLYQQFNQQ